MMGSCSLLADSVKYLCKRDIKRSCAILISRLREASFGEAESSTSPLSDSTREIASTIPCASGNPAAICASRGYSSVLRSSDFFSSRHEISVDFTSRSCCGSRTPPRPARSAAERMSCAPPIPILSFVENNLRASLVSPRRARARAYESVGWRERANSIEAEKSQKAFNRSRIFGYSRTDRVFASIHSNLTTRCVIGEWNVEKWRIDREI